MNRVSLGSGSPDWAKEPLSALVPIDTTIPAASFRLQTEGTPPEDAFNPAVKRSGWQPPRDTGLWSAADAVRSKVWGALEPQTAEHLKVRLSLCACCPRMLLLTESRLPRCVGCQSAP
jgi:hypothetical protein